MTAAELPVASLFDGVIGHDAAVAFLRASAQAPVHAYLFVGPDSAGALAAARGFAAALLCPNGGDGTCSACVRVLHNTHPDLAVIERSGASILVDEAREVTRLALRTPMESTRKVLVLTDFHAVEEAAPALLKTIEEPPPSAVFIVLADQVTPDLVTIASRCVRVDFAALPDEVIVGALAAEGVAHAVAVDSAQLACGSLARARAVASDKPMRDRMAVWRAVPDQLDGTAGTVVAIAGALTALLDAAAAPVVEQHKRDDAEMAERAKAGLPIPSRRDVEVRQRRAQRRARTDELRAGLGVLASVYRERAATGDRTGARRAVAALEAIAAAADDMQYNPNEMPLLEGLLARISS